MKPIIISALGTLCLAGLSTMSAAAKPAKAKAQGPDLSRPNVVIFLVDDLGGMDTGFAGSEFYETPNIDRMAADGMIFTNSYAACTVSSPSRAAMMTGKYPARLHLTDWIDGHNYPYAKFLPPDWKHYLDLGETTLADVLHAKGYATWHIGKWHLGDDEQYDPQHRGFDVNLGGGKYGSPRKTKDGCNGYFSPFCLPYLPEGPEGEYLPERLTEEAIKLIDASDGTRPFFLNMCHYDVHIPLMAREADIERWRARVDESKGQKNPVYAAMVEDVDKSLGAIIEALRRKGVLDNTLIFFTGDNGGWIPSTDNSPFRAGKGSAYEGGVRVPLAVMWKAGGVPAGSKSDYPVITMDIPTTIMDIVGSPQAKKTDGESLMPLFKGQTLPERALFWHYPHYHPGGSRTYAAIRMGDWRLVYKFEDNSVELYNLKDDIGETNNLAGSQPGKAAEMLARLKAWQNEVGAQMPVPNPNYDPQRQSKVGKGAEER